MYNPAICHHHVGSRRTIPDQEGTETQAFLA